MDDAVFAVLPTVIFLHPKLLLLTAKCRLTVWFDLSDNYVLMGVLCIR